MKKKLLATTAVIGVLAKRRRDDESSSTETSADAPSETEPPNAPGGRGTSPGSSGDGQPGSSATGPTDVPAAGWKQIGKRTLAEVKADRVPMMAAAVAFAGLLAIFPAMVAAVSLFGLLADPSTVADVADRLAVALPADAAALVTGQLDSLAAATDASLSGSFALSLLAALWGASRGIEMLVRGVNVAYDEEDQRNVLQRKGLALLLTLGALVFFVASVGLITVVPPVLEGLGLGVVATVGVQLVRLAILVGLLLVGLAVLYRFAPDRSDARWRWLTPGAVASSVLWLVGSFAFSLFVDNFGSYNETYGALAGVVVLMLWLQLSALVVLLGAELNAEAERQTLRDTTVGPPAPIGQRGADPADVPPHEADDGQDDRVIDLADDRVGARR